jgi:hypothetical protein
MLEREVAASVLEALESEVVRLQGSTFQELLNASQGQAQALLEALQPFVDRAGTAWERAGDIAALHLQRVMRNNPTMPLETLMRRPDVRAVLSTPFADATAETKAAIQGAWDAGASHGLTAANQDLQIAELEPVEGPPAPDQPVLNRLLGDADANGAAARERFISGIQGGPDEVHASLQAAGRSQARRARAGADVAGKHSWASAKEEAMARAAAEQGIMIYKVWVTSFTSGTCPTCAALHGTRRPLGQPFPKAAHFGDQAPPRVYGASLNHPPRHPNCRCRIVLHLSAFEGESGPTIATMRAASRAWWKALLEAIGLRRRRRG